MANYFLNHFSTGLKATHAEASLSLETFLAGLDVTTNPIIEQGIAATKRDREQCVGWVVFENYFSDSSYHLHFADNIDLAVS